MRSERVWAMLHSGSRGIGNRIGSYFIAKAREALERRQLTRPLPDKDLAWLRRASRCLRTTSRRSPGRRNLRARTAR